MQGSCMAPFHPTNEDSTYGFTFWKVTWASAVLLRARVKYAEKEVRLVGFSVYKKGYSAITGEWNKIAIYEKYEANKRKRNVKKIINL